MASELTHFLRKIDLYKDPDLIELNLEEKIIYDFCLGQGYKTQTGFFSMGRSEIEFFLNMRGGKNSSFNESCAICTDRKKYIEEVLSSFCLKHPKIIDFFQKEHLIWVKPFYRHTEVGISGNIYKEKKDKNGESFYAINRNQIYKRNTFVSTINSVFRNQLKPFSNHRFIEEWVEYNYLTFSEIEEDIKLLKKNNRGFRGVIRRHLDKISDRIGEKRDIKKLSTDLLTGMENMPTLI